MQNNQMNNQNKQSNGIENNPYINQQQNLNMLSQNNNQQQNPYYNTNQSQINTQSTQDTQGYTLSSFYNENFFKGAIIGAVGAYLLTNENAQKTIFKTFAKGADFLSAGMEEIKERMEDAKAELEAEKEEN